jgi:hypothetical protein
MPPPGRGLANVSAETPSCIPPNLTGGRTLPQRGGTLQTLSKTLLCCLLVAPLLLGCSQSSAPVEPAGDDSAPIRIVEPVEGATVAGGRVTVRVEIPGVSIDDAHWHLIVDDQVSGMVSHMNETSLQLAPGEHVLVAVMSSMESHEELPGGRSEPIQITVTP